MKTNTHKYKTNKNKDIAKHEDSKSTQQQKLKTNKQQIRVEEYVGLEEILKLHETLFLLSLFFSRRFSQPQRAGGRGVCTTPPPPHTHNYIKLGSNADADAFAHQSVHCKFLPQLRPWNRHSSRKQNYYEDFNGNTSYAPYSHAKRRGNSFRFLSVIINFGLYYKKRVQLSHVSSVSCFLLQCDFPVPCYATRASCFFLGSMIKVEHVCQRIIEIVLFILWK